MVKYVLFVLCLVSVASFAAPVEACPIQTRAVVVEQQIVAAPACSSYSGCNVGYQQAVAIPVYAPPVAIVEVPVAIREVREVRSERVVRSRSVTRTVSRSR